ncbi:MAG: endonuclease related protein, partial [Campylobacterota bacterium]|nr:endonuclease related protein [Campylobacterota bacterium]
SGYFNQKARYILEFIKFYRSLNGTTPTREALLNVVGIGEETADSILLYGYNQLQFKVDTYTKRMLVELDFVDEKAKYGDIKALMEGSLKEYMTDEKELLKIYQEFHALIVNHGKNFYSKKPYGVGCFLKNNI